MVGYDFGTKSGLSFFLASGATSQGLLQNQDFSLVFEVKKSLLGSPNIFILYVIKFCAIIHSYYITEHKELKIGDFLFTVMQ